MFKTVRVHKKHSAAVVCLKHRCPTPVLTRSPADFLLVTFWLRDDLAHLLITRLNFGIPGLELDTAGWFEIIHHFLGQKKKLSQLKR